MICNEARSERSNAMAYRHGNRVQMDLLPPALEDYVGEKHPVRVYDAIVDQINLQEIGIDLNAWQVGNPRYDPQSMLKLLVYGYSYGIKSSRKLERECHQNMSFLWLMGGLKPDHKTIAEFRRKNKKALQLVLKQSVRVCMKLDLIAGNVLFVDGTKIRANAARHRAHDRGYYEKQLAQMEARITQLLEDCEAADQDEEGMGSFVAMNEELVKVENLKEKIREALEYFETSDRKTVNFTDPDCALMKSVQGSHASYNVQSVVEDQNGLIVHAEAVTAPTDIHQLAEQIDHANGQLGKKCETACADAGYSDSNELEKIEAQGIIVVVPSQRQALHEEEGPFSKSHFAYDKAQDCYTCPEGHLLAYQSTDKRNGKRHYQIVGKNTCRNCPHYGQCTKSKRGRQIVRLPNEEAKQRFEQLCEQHPEVYARRKTKAEHPFGHIKRNLKTDAFLLRGKDGVQAETSILATCFNVARMITIFGTGTLLAKLEALGAITC